MEQGEQECYNPIIGPCPQIDEESVMKVLCKMKNGKASGTSRVVSEMLLVLMTKVWSR